MNTQKKFQRGMTMLAMVAVLATSCSKDDSKGGSSNQIIAKIQKDANNYTAFETNGDGLTTKVTSVEDGTPQVITITYNAQNKPTTGSFDDAALRYVYAGNQLDTLYYGESEDLPALYSKLKYQNNQVITLVNYLDMPNGQDDFPLAKHTYEYAGNDVKTQTIYEWDMDNDEFIMSEKYTFEYDTKVNPLKNMALISLSFFQVTSEHNPLKKTEYDADGTVVKTTTYTYNYNAAGLPTSVEEKEVTPGNPTGITTTTTFTYK
jgi:hypothetical protein